MPQQPYTFSLGGGLDLVTPDLGIPDGRVLGGQNYEAGQQGYRRVQGFERYDGRPSPSSATYWVLNFDAGGPSFAVDEVVTGGTSGATGTVLVAPVLESGDYSLGTAAGHLVLASVSGTFQDDEVLSGSVAGDALANGAAIEGGASTDADNTTWMNAARAARRAVIAAVPGSGAVRGVWALSGNVYAIRDNAGGTAGVLHKATSSGWAAQDLGHYIKFDAGTAAFAEGETVTGGTSGATATVRRVVLTSGTYSGTDAAGFLTISGITGTFQNNEALTGSVAGAATANGTQIANALPAGGRYDFANANFFGAAAGVRMYAAGGVGRAWEWDGTYFTEIRTGLSDANDKPTFVEEYKDHLFLGYEAGSWLFSSIGNPLEYDAATGGAGEIAVGAKPTGAIRASGTIVLFSDTRIDYIVGSSAADFIKTPILSNVGAQAWSVQHVMAPIYSSDLALYALNMEDAGEGLAGWRMASMSQTIEPMLRNKRTNGVTPVASLRIKTRDTYWLFFSDDTALSVYLGREAPEIMIVNLGVTMSCAYSGDETGSEMLLIGASDGFVYDVGRGNDFDGEEIEAFVRLSFVHCGNPYGQKRFHSARLELEGGAVSTLSMAADFDYGSPDTPVSPTSDFEVSGGGGFWGVASWDQFYWDSQVVGTAEGEINGAGRNISVVISSDSTNEDPHTLSNMTIWWTPRRLLR